MSAPIVLNGISNLVPPGVYGQLNLGAGQNSQPTSVYAVILLGNINSQGSAYTGIDGYTIYGPDTQIPMQSVNDAINLFGAGTPLMLGVQRFMDVNKSTPVYAMPVPDAGLLGSGVAASLSFTVTAAGSPSQTSGVVQVQIDDKVPVQASIGALDTATTIATNLVNNINGNVNLPVTASNVAGAVTLTAKIKGARGNWLRAYPKIVAGSGVTLSVNAPTFFTSGAGSDAAGYTACLNSLAVTGVNGGFFYYYVPEAGFDSVDGTANGIAALVQSQIDTLAQPISGLRQRALFGSVDTLAHTETVATAINDARCEAVWCKNLDLTPFELACKAAAAYTLFETSPLAATGVNFDSFGGDPGSQPFWNVPAPLDGSAPSATDIQSAILNGISPLRVVRGGNTNIVKRVTSHFQQTAGASTVLDLRITDAGKVTISDYFMNDLMQLLLTRYPRKLIVNDPPQGAPPAAAGTVSPSQVRNTVLEVIQNYASANLINGVSSQQGLIVQRETNPTTRISISVPLFTNDPLHTIVLLVNQVA